jgi:hypothetical protein
MPNLPSREHVMSTLSSEAWLRTEIDRAVAPYVGKFPPFVVAKLRQLAERYWRENPKASAVLRMMDRGGRTSSGDQVIGAAGDDEPLAANGTEKV